MKPLNSRQARSQRGLSLLELLVVFVIISLVSTVLVQGFGFGLALYERVQTRTDRIANELLVANWFRSSLEAMVAGKTVETTFHGETDRLRGVTLNPLLGESGSPADFEWRLDRGVLTYRESGSELTVRDAGETIQRFEYLDSDGAWLSTWSPTPEKLELPGAIRVMADEGTVLLATVRSRLAPDLLLEESRRER